MKYSSETGEEKEKKRASSTTTKYSQFNVRFQAHFLTNHPMIIVLRSPLTLNKINQVFKQDIINNMWWIGKSGKLKIFWLFFCLIFAFSKEVLAKIREKWKYYTEKLNKHLRVEKFVGDLVFYTNKHKHAWFFFFAQSRRFEIFYNILVLPKMIKMKIENLSVDTSILSLASVTAHSIHLQHYEDLQKVNRYLSSLKWESQAIGTFARFIFFFIFSSEC